MGDNNGKKFSVALSDEKGLQLTWFNHELNMLSNIPIRVYIRGTHVFRIWGHDSGEGAPVWSEPDMDIVLFGGKAETNSIHSAGNTPSGCALLKNKAETGFVMHSLEEVQQGGLIGFRAKAVHGRVAAMLDIIMDDGELAMSLSIENPQPLGGFSLPLCQCELDLCDMPVHPDCVFQAANLYQGNEFAFGRVKSLNEQGVSFHHGCIGLGLPLAYLYHSKMENGLQFEFMMEGRPAFGFRRGFMEDSCNAFLSWGTERLLQPGQVHAYGGFGQIHAHTKGRPTVAG